MNESLHCDSCRAPGCYLDIDLCGCQKIICDHCMDDGRLGHIAGGPHKLLKDVVQCDSVVKQAYVVGFLFDPSLRRVVLIRKTKPQWQAGKWNGVGGKIESGEQPYNAMCREFFEETGMVVADWKEFCILTGVEFRDNKRIEQDFAVYFFVSVVNQIGDAKTQGDETVENWCLDDVGRIIPTVYHLPWLLPMAIGYWRMLSTAKATTFEVKEINQ